jgi:hypothetical protein
MLDLWQPHTLAEFVTKKRDTLRRLTRGRSERWKITHLGDAPEPGVR